MKKGIPCFDYYEIGPKGQNRISFRFVTEEGEFVSACSVSLGDTDPLTGEIISDPALFREYHLLRNREIYRNKKQAAVPWSMQEKTCRKRLREEIALEFADEYGYLPDKGTLDWLVNEKMPKQYRTEIDSFYNENGEYWSDCVAEFADPVAETAFAAAEEEGHTLDDFERTLTPLQRDVFLMLRMKSEGMPVRGMGKRLAEKWGVDKSDISKTKLRIGKLLREWMEEDLG